MICSGYDYSRNKVSDQGHSDPKMVQDTQLFQDASTHRIRDAYLK